MSYYYERGRRQLPGTSCGSRASWRSTCSRDRFMMCSTRISKKKGEHSPFQFLLQVDFQSDRRRWCGSRGTGGASTARVAVAESGATARPRLGAFVGGLSCAVTDSHQEQRSRMPLQGTVATSSDQGPRQRVAAYLPVRWASLELQREVVMRNTRVLVLTILTHPFTRI